MTAIRKETIDFLKQVKKNNNRDWFNANKQKYIDAQANVSEFVGELITKIAGFDKSVSGVEPKNCIFRIYRDTRFSHDKTPYKTHFGAVIAGSQKSMKQLKDKAGYYIHIEPGASFIAGGVHSPEPERLKLIREDISMEGKKFLKIINEKEFIKNFNEVKGEKLKTVPKGFNKNDKMLKYLQLKDVYVHHKVNDNAMLNPKLATYCATIFKSMVPFNAFLNASIQPG